jgi:hypothetical protein
MSQTTEKQQTVHHAPGPYEVRIVSTCSGAWPEIVPVGADEDEEAVARCGTAFVFDYERPDAADLAVTYDERPDCFVPTEDSAEVMANARLFAAAPTMAEALDEVEAAEARLYEIVGHPDAEYRPELLEPLAEIRAAVNKARAARYPT